MSGLALLIEKYTRELEELQARTKETGRRLEVVMEASRFLEAEGLSEEGPSGYFG